MGKIRHIAIRCEDTEKTAQWLHDALELQLVQRRGSGAIDLSDGDVNITLLPLGLGTGEHTARPGFEHIGVTVADDEAARQRLLAGGRGRAEPDRAGRRVLRGQVPVARGSGRRRRPLGGHQPHPRGGGRPRMSVARTVVGSGELTFELVPDWEQLPRAGSHGDVAGVATDSPGPRLRLQPQRAPASSSTTATAVPRLVGRGRLHPSARHHHPRRRRLLRRRHRPHRARASPSTASCCGRSARSTSPATPAIRPKGRANLRRSSAARGRSTGRRGSRSRPTASCTSRTATATRASTASRPTAS